MEDDLVVGIENKWENLNFTKPVLPSRGGTSAKPDYVLVFCYILVYLEVAWLIYMLVRSYSRD